MRPLEEIKADWRDALQELEKAHKEYSEYLDKPFAALEKSMPILFEKLNTASDKVRDAKNKESHFWEEYIEALRNYNYC